MPSAPRRKPSRDVGGDAPQEEKAHARAGERSGGETQNGGDVDVTATAVEARYPRASSRWR